PRVSVGQRDLLSDPFAGLRLLGELFGAEGRVIPMAAVPLEIEADVSHDGWANSQTIRGQSRVAVTSGHVHKLRLQPPDAPARPAATEATHAADWVTPGPGSGYTSALTQLLVPGLAHASRTSTAEVGLTWTI